MDSGDLELVNRIVRDVEQRFSDRINALEALLGIDTWNSAADSLVSIEARLFALESRPAVEAEIAAPVVEVAAEEIIAEAAEAAEEIVADAVEAAEEIIADAVETVAEVVDDIVPGPLDDIPPAPGDSDPVVDEILGEHPDATPTPQRGGFWHGEILRRRS